MVRSSFALALLLAGLPAPLVASEPVPHVVVPHADLDLAQPAARARLERRVRNAAESLCPHAGRSLRDRIEAARCREIALAQADVQVRQAVAAATATAGSRLAGSPQEDQS